jgi:hypothetical protein
MEPDDWEWVFGWIITIALLLIYLLPTVFAIKWRHRRWYGVALFNLALGWTIIGWFLAFNWAVKGHPNRDNFDSDGNSDPDSHLAFPRDIEDALDDLDDD